MADSSNDIYAEALWLKANRNHPEYAARRRALGVRVDAIPSSAGEPTAFGRRVMDSVSAAPRVAAAPAAAPSATFEDQFEELFGNRPTYDPIRVGGEGEGDTSFDTGEGDGDNAFQSNLDKLYDSIINTKAAPPAEDNAFGEDTLRALGAGVAQTGEMAAGALEYGARQARRKLGPGVGREVLDDITAGLTDLRQQMGGQASEWMQGMSPEAVDSMQRHVLSLDPNQSIWRGGPGKTLDSIAMQVTQSLPATVLTLLPVARWFRAGMTPAAITYLGASEGGLSLGGIANSIAKEVEQMTPEQLAQESERYQQLLDQGADPEAARQQLIGEAQGNAPLIGGVLVGAISSTAGRYLEPVFEKGAGLLARTATGVAEEALQEGPQSAVEQYVQNVAAQVYDQNRSPMEGVGEQAASGMLIGSVSGGGFSAVMGGGAHAPQENGPSTGERAPDQPGASFEQVFGKNQDDFLMPPPGRAGRDNESGSLIQLIEPGSVTPEIRAAMKEAGQQSMYLPGGVTPEIRAAMEEAGQQSMYLPEPGELEQRGRQGTFPASDMQQASQQPFNRVALPDGQQEMPLRVHRRGGFQTDSTGTVQPPTDYSPDLSAPPGVTQDPRQQDFVTPSQQGTPDTPSAEPLVDIQAQLDEMDRPEATEREAVYLSADNLAQLQSTGELPAILERGVPLANFDGKGGLLIARDRQVADSLVQLRNEGGDMQELLGTATGAGLGKPAGGGITVQRRQNGAVVQESVVADEAEADQLASEWETKYPNDDVAVLTIPAALGRRSRLLQQESQSRTQRQVDQGLRSQREQGIEQTSQQVRRATAAMPPSRRETARQITAGAQTPSRAAARLLGQATRESAKPEQQRIGGFYPPAALDFADTREGQRYSTRFGKLTDLEIERELADRERESAEDEMESIRAEEKPSWKKGEEVKEFARRTKQFEEHKRSRIEAQAKRRGSAVDQLHRTKQEREKLLDELAEIRTRAKPIRKAAHLTSAAQRVAPEAVKKVQSEVARTAKHEPEDDVGVHEPEPDITALRKLTDSQIDKMSGDALSDAFDNAARWLSGRVPEGVEITMGFTPATESDQRTYAETQAEKADVRLRGFYRSTEEGVSGGGERKYSRIRGAELPEVLRKRHPSPSLKRKLIRRVRNMLASQAHGGRTQSKPITKSSVGMKTRPDVQHRKGKFETQVLAADVLPQDEPRGERLKREASVKRARERLEKTTRRAFSHLDKLTSGKYEEQAQEKDGEELSDAARNLIHGRAYFRVLADFGQAMVRSGNQSTAILEEMDKLDEFLRNAMGMPARDFARVFGNLLRAESQTQASELKSFGDYKTKLADPEKRDAANAEILARLLAEEAHQARLEGVWRKNPYYLSIVEPLMRKITDSTFRNGYPSYKPTEDEMLKLQWVMNNWKATRELRDRYYTPIRRAFTNAGFQWTPTKNVNGVYTGGELIVPYVESKSKADKGRRWIGEGDAKKPIRYKYSLSDRALRPLYVEKFGPTDLNEGGGVQLHSEVAATKPRAVMPAPSSRLDTLGRLLAANRVIGKFRDLVKGSKITVAGMIRTEERLVRAFKELGMWTQTSPVMGSVRFQSGSRAYRLVGPRLLSKELSKEEGRKLLLQQMKRQSVADELYAGHANVQERANRPLKAETEMFLERVTNPGASIEDFRKTALAVNQLLDDTARVHTLDQLLDVLVEGLPSDHVYAHLAQKLRAAGVGSTPVSWDIRRSLADKQLGAAKWADDANMPGGRFRYILLNRSGILRPTYRNGNPRESGATLLHTLLHEATHIATQGAIDRNAVVRQAFGTLQVMAKRFMRNEGGITDDADMPYGLKEGKDVGEFVAEAFSNLRFQQMLKRIRFDGSSLWQRFTDFVKNILGISAERPEPKNAFEAVLSLEHHLFTGEDRSSGATEMHLNVDEALRPAATNIMNNIRETGENFRRGWARSRGVNAPLIMMTMRQIHKEFRRHFGVGKNSLDQYHENWERRNAENSRLMEAGEAVSREWSAATEATSTADAMEFSRLITESTLGGVHPDRAVNAVGNEHIKLADAKARHAELAARFSKLPAKWQEMYKRVGNYYTRTLEQETNLLMLNALRGTLASGDNAVMSRAEFDRKYTEDSVRSKKLSTQEGLEKEFGALDRAMLRTLQEIASIPTKREGPYFPLTRYGNYVVYAQRAAETKTFADSKAAYAYRAKKIAEDPTFDVGVRKVAEGQYAVHTVERDFRTAETVTEAEKIKEEMVELYGRPAVTDVQLKDTFKAEETIQSGSALAGILTNLKGNTAAQNAIKNYWLRSLADKSFRKHQIRRKNRRGVDFDLQHRSFTNYVKQASYYISQLKFGWRMADSFRDLQKFVKDSRDTPETTSLRLGQVRDELRKRDEMTNGVDQLPQVVRKATELGQLFMLFGPSYWLINATQPYMVTVPWLGARYGWGGATSALANAQKLILSPILRAGKDSFGGAKAYFSKMAAEKAFNVLEQVKETIKQRGGERAPAYIDMLEQLRQQSVIDLSWIAELRDISEGRSTTAYQRFMDATRVMAHLTEVNNRIVTALAAYDLRYNEVMARQGATHELAHTAAIQTAKDAVAETQFDYSSGNKPRLFQTGGPAGKLAPLVFQFMQYSQHMYAMMISNFATAVRRGDMDRLTAAKTLAGLFATHAAAAGVLGVALQPLKWAIGLMLLAFGSDDEPWTVANAASGESFDRWAREGLADMFGNKLGAVVAQGLPEAAGVRLTDRMALGTVYYLDLKTDTAESTLGSVAKGFLGPVVGEGFNAIRAGQFMLQGEPRRAIEALAPKAVADAMRAYRYGTQGIVNNAGDTFMPASEISPWQLFMQSMGFRPSEIADKYSAQAVKKETEALGQDRRDALLARFRKAKTNADREAVLSSVVEFNKKFPAHAVTRSSLIRALTAKAEREAGYEKFGAALRGRSRLYADEGEYYDTE